MRSKILLTILLAVILVGNAYAQHPWMIKDINTTGTANGPVGSNGSFDGQSQKTTYTANGVDFFKANDGVNGFEMWRTDGTAAGTYMLADITPGAGSTTFGNIYEAGNLLYFYVYNNSSFGYISSVWRSDGTVAGTYSIMTTTGGHSISGANDEVNDGFHNYATRMGNNFYFTVTDSLAKINYNGSVYPNYHCRVYKTDGTVSGTSVYYDAGVQSGSIPVPSISYGSISNVIAVGSKLYIVGINNVSAGVAQSVLSSGDGTTVPTVIYAPGGNFGVSPSMMINVNDNYLLMIANIGSNSNLGLYRLKSTETTPVFLQTVTNPSVLLSDQLTESSDFATGNLYFFNSDNGKSVTNGEVAGTFALSGITGTAELYTGIVNNKMTFFNISDNKLYWWDGLSPTSYQVVSDSLAGKNIRRVIQVGNRVFYLNSSSLPIQTSDLSGSNCLAIYPADFIGSGNVLNNNYIDFGLAIDGSFNAGEEPHLQNFYRRGVR
jgi:ELWxxDGT repeat protein